VKRNFLAIIRRAAERKAIRNPDALKAVTPEDIHRMVHELQVHQIELEMQNENLLLLHAELDASRSGYFDLYDMAPVGYCTLSEKGIILAANLAIATLLGVVQKTLINRPFSQFVSMDQQDRYYLFWQNLFKEDASGEFELRLMKSDGKSVWARLTATTAQDPDGLSICRMVIHDISDFKQAEEALHKSQSLLAKAEELGKVGGWQLDVETRRQIWTKTVYDIHEMEVSEALTLNEGLHFYTSASRPVIERAVQRAIELGESFDVELEIITAKGSPRSVHVIGKPELAHRRICGFFQDITERKRAEMALCRSEAMLKESQKIAHMGSWYLDLATNTVVWTEELYRMYGFDPAEPVPPYSEHHKLFTPNSWAKLSVALENTRVTGDPYELELMTVRFDGGNGWMRVRGERVCDEHNIPIGLRGIAQDITEHKRTELALKHSMEQFHTLAELAPVGIYIIDPDWNCEYSNPAWCKMAGMTSEEALGKGWIKGLHPDDRVRVLDRWNEMMGNQNQWELEFRFVDKAGVVTTVYGLATPQVDASGEIVRYIGVNTDITERKRSEDALQQREEKFRALVENAPVLVNGFSATGRSTLWNRECEKVFGWTVEEINAHNEPLALLYPDTEVRKQVLDSVTTQPEKTYREWHPLTRDGRELTVLWANFHMSNGLIINIGHDITERKRGEVESENLQVQLSHAQKMESIGRLAGGVAHDFNNMLQAILGYTELALDHVAPTEPLYADLKEIEKAAFRSADTTRQLLMFARKQTIVPEVLDLNQTVADMLKLLQRLIGEDIDLVWKPGSEVWPIKMDPSQIDQILANLCINARDAITDVGRVTIETENVILNKNYCALHAGFLPGDYVLLTLRDTGCGMDYDTQARLFEPFFTTKDVGKGTGLGLATIYGVVKQNKGFIHVDSAPNEGTVFKVYLPRYTVQVKALSEQAPAKEVVRASETILLVEDELAILKMTAMVLERQGYSVLAAGTPGEAIRMAREHAGEIDLLITDVIMPEMNGRDLAGNIQSIYPEIKRLFMSGYTADVISPHGVLNQGVHFLEKPFAVRDLLDRVREVLKK
jgi:two-component system cell cycle sensor histidine kinase/response regulator CckA